MCVDTSCHYIHIIKRENERVITDAEKFANLCCIMIGNDVYKPYE